MSAENNERDEEGSDLCEGVRGHRGRMRAMPDGRVTAPLGAWRYREFLSDTYEDESLCTLPDRDPTP